MSPIVAIVPAYQASATVGTVVRGLAGAWSGNAPPIVVVDDGSTDGTDDVAREAGAHVVRHLRNRGKGAALRTGFEEALRLGATLAVTVDADGQHPAHQAMRLASSPAPPHAIVLGYRDMMQAGAPSSNRFSNAFSNVWVSFFTGRHLVDTQCGLRRYPLPSTLELGSRASGYGFESEVLVRAARLGVPIVQEPVEVIYPPAEERLSHFRVARDPARIVGRLLYTYATAPRTD